MKKPNLLLSIGLFINAIMLTLKHFSINLPDSIVGLGFGIGLGLELLGIFSMSHDISKYKNYKVNFLNKLLNR